MLVFSFVAQIIVNPHLFPIYILQIFSRYVLQPTKLGRHVQFPDQGLGSGVWRSIEALGDLGKGEAQRNGARYIGKVKIRSKTWLSQGFTQGKKQNTQNLFPFQIPFDFIPTEWWFPRTFCVSLGQGGSSSHVETVPGRLFAFLGDDDHFFGSWTQITPFSGSPPKTLSQTLSRFQVTCAGTFATMWLCPWVWMGRCLRMVRTVGMKPVLPVGLNYNCSWSRTVTKFWLE